MAQQFDSRAEVIEELEQRNIRPQAKVTVNGRSTTAGREKVNSILPDGYEVNKRIDDDVMSNLMQEISREKPENFSEIINELRKLGEKWNYLGGFSVGLEDVELLENRDEIVQQAQSELDQIDLGNKQRVSEIGSKYVNKVSDELENRMKDSDNNFYDMVWAGSRGSMDQLQQMLASPVMLRDSQNDPVPVAIEGSYGEGMDMGDYWNTLYGARKGIIDRRLGMSKPGEISKFLIKTINNQVITEKDCGTKNGEVKKVENKWVLGRASAENIDGIVNRNEIIDENIVQELRENDVDEIKVRSPMTCEAKDGICQLCYGHDEFNDLPEIGSNVGAKAGQSVSQPIQQMSMNVFHTGGIVQEPDSDDVKGIDKIDKLLTMPKNIPQEAPLAKDPGKVKNIEEREGGGYQINLETINGNEESHFVPEEMNPTVDEGDEVARADKLTEGIPDPSKMVDLVGIKESRKRLKDELVDGYEGFNIDEKALETITKGVTDLVRVKDPTEDDDFVPGDYARYADVHARNKEKAEEVPVRNAEGMYLTEEINTENVHIREGKQPTSKDIQELRSEGVETVEAANEAISFKPEYAGINTINNYRPDWLVNAGFSRIRSALQKGVAEGRDSDIKGYQPIPAFAWGKDFGETQDSVPGGY